MFGLGGIYVELFKDVSFRLAPVSQFDIKEMIQETKSYKLLTGLRGDKPADIESLEDCIARFSQLALDIPEITEFDINPLVVHEKGCHVLDARIMLHKI
jgi:acyl-CoA synthetase (NDP forming)